MLQFFWLWQVTRKGAHFLWTWNLCLSFVSLKHPKIISQAIITLIFLVSPPSFAKPSQRQSIRPLGGESNISSTKQTDHNKTNQDSDSGGPKTVTSTSNGKNDEDDIKWQRAKSASEHLKQYKNQINCPTKATGPKIMTLEARPTIAQCISKLTTASTMCLEKYSPYLSTMLSHSQMALSGIQTLMNVTDKCASLNKAMLYTNLGLTGYMTACSIAAKSCKSACGAAVDAIKNDIGQVRQHEAESASGATKHTHDYDIKLLLGFARTAEQSVQFCEEYLWKLKVGATLLGASIMTQRQALNCEAQTSASFDFWDCNKNPNQAHCVECQKPEFKAHKLCACAWNPRDPSCATNLGNLIETKPFQPDGSGSSSLDTQNAGLTGGSFGFDGGLNQQGGGGVGSDFGTFGGGGGGGAGLGGGGGVSGVDQPETSKNTAGLKGKGSYEISDLKPGGSRKGWGRFESGVEEENPYLQYLPDRNPSATQTDKENLAFSISQVTGKNGLSNFEKIKKRYQEKRATFLGAD